MKAKSEAAEEQKHNAIQTTKEDGGECGMKSTESAGAASNTNFIRRNVDYTKIVTFALIDLGIYSEAYSKLQATASADGMLNVCWQANSSSNLRKC